MTKTLAENQAKELQVEETIEQLKEGTRAVNHLEEAYEDFFYQTTHLFSELKEQFFQNDIGLPLEHQWSEIQQYQAPLFESLEEEKQDRRQQILELEDKRASLRKQRAVLLSEEETNTDVD